MKDPPLHENSLLLYSFRLVSHHEIGGMDAPCQHTDGSTYSHYLDRRYSYDDEEGMGASCSFTRMIITDFLGSEVVKADESPVPIGEH